MYVTLVARQEESSSSLGALRVSPGLHVEMQSSRRGVALLDVLRMCQGLLNRVFPLILSCS